MHNHRMTITSSGHRRYDVECESCDFKLKGITMKKAQEIKSKYNNQ